MASCFDEGINLLQYNTKLYLESSVTSSFICSIQLHISDTDSEMRLVNVKEISKAGVALELAEFQALVSRHIDAAKECLKTQWFPTVQDVFLLVSELIFLCWLDR